MLKFRFTTCFELSNDDKIGAPEKVILHLKSQPLEAYKIKTFFSLPLLDLIAFRP
jgi:hypothetical protein